MSDNPWIPLTSIQGVEADGVSVLYRQAGPERPEQVTAIVSQNGNAYEDGLGDAREPIQRYWREPTLDAALLAFPLETHLEEGGFARHLFLQQALAAAL
jgi:hypothetical protein